MKKLFPAALILLCFSNCKQDKGWSAEEQKKGMTMCMNEINGKLDEATGKKYCDCVVDKMQKKYKTYEEADRVATEADGREIGKSCIAELKIDINQGDHSTAPGGTPGWSEDWKSKFIKECSDGLVEKGRDRGFATSYCSCVLEKTMKKYKDSNEADMSGTEDEGRKMGTECMAEMNAGNH